MKTIVGVVLASCEKAVKNSSGGEYLYYENMVDFGNGCVVITSGKSLPLGNLHFAVVRKSNKDFSAKLSAVVDPSSLPK